MGLSLTLDVAISLIFVWLLSALLAGAVNEVIAGWLNLRGAYLTKAIETLTSLGTNNVFAWGGPTEWFKAVWQSKPSAPKNEMDLIAIDARKRATEAAKKENATPQLVADATKVTPNFQKLNLDRSVDEAVNKAGATPDSVAAVLCRIGGVADLQTHPLLVGTPKGLPSYVPSRDFATALLGVLTEGAKDSQAAFAQAKDVINDLPDGDLKKILLSFIDSGETDLAKLRTRIENWFDDAMERLAEFTSASTNT
jgi:hypothetical protein